MHVGELRVSCSNHGDRAVDAVFSVEGGEPVAGAQRLEGGDNCGPGFISGSLDVDEQVQCLAGGSIVDAIMLAFFAEGSGGILPGEGVEQGVDVE